MHTLIASLVLVLAAPLRPDAEARAPALTVEGRTLQHAGIVNAPAEEVWKAFTTEEGWTTAIGVARCEIDFRVGGTIRSVYNPDATVGDDSTITNTILAYEPERMLAMKAIAPKNAPDFIKAICETGWSVIRFEPLTPDRTRLTITGMGYMDTELHQKAYDFFDTGNAWTLKKIQDHFARPEHAAAIDDAEKLIFRISGKWAFTKERDDGTKFSGETTGALLFQGKVLVADGYLTFGDNTFHHSHFIAARDPETNSMRAWSFNEQGDVTEGEIRMESPEKLVLDWHTHKRDTGGFVDYRVEYTFNGPDEFRCVVLDPPGADGGRAPRVDVTYRRAEPAAIAK